MQILGAGFAKEAQNRLKEILAWLWSIKRAISDPANRPSSQCEVKLFDPRAFISNCGEIKFVDNKYIPHYITKIRFAFLL